MTDTSFTSESATACLVKVYCFGNCGELCAKCSRTSLFAPKGYVIGSRVVLNLCSENFLFAAATATLEVAYVYTGAQRHWTLMLKMMPPGCWLVSLRGHPLMNSGFQGVCINC